MAEALAAMQRAGTRYGIGTVFKAITESGLGNGFRP